MMNNILSSSSMEQKFPLLIQEHQEQQPEQQLESPTSKKETVNKRMLKVSKLF